MDGQGFEQQKQGDAASDPTDLDRFLYLITHDFKASARAMTCLPDWIADDLRDSGLEVPAEVQEHIVMLQRSARQMHEMLEGLTVFSRVGRLSDPAGAHDLTNLVKTVWNGFDRNKGRVSLELNALSVTGPGNDLRTLFGALFDNAIRHGGAGQIGIQVSAALLPDGRVEVVFADDGKGIPDDLREQIFEPLRSLRARDETGCAGMGLTIARKIVETLGGRMICREARGGGCALRFDLPAASPQI